MVLPDFAAPLSDSCFRQVAGNLFARCVPAHLNYALYWTSAAALKTFEGFYGQWLALLQQYQTDGSVAARLNSASAALVKWLQGAEDEQP